MSKGPPDEGGMTREARIIYDELIRLGLRTANLPGDLTTRACEGIARIARKYHIPAAAAARVFAMQRAALSAIHAPAAEPAAQPDRPAEESDA